MTRTLTLASCTALVATLAGAPALGERNVECEAPLVADADTGECVGVENAESINSSRSNLSSVRERGNAVGATAAGTGHETTAQRGDRALVEVPAVPSFGGGDVGFAHGEAEAGAEDAPDAFGGDDVGFARERNAEFGGEDIGANDATDEDVAAEREMRDSDPER